MSVHYIIDGYNVIKQVPYLNEKKLEEARNKFIDFLEIHRPQGNLRNEVTVVFDGKSQRTSSTKIKSIRVIFTNNETADDKIKMMVKRASNRKRIIVVTDDKEIRSFIKNLCARPVSVKKFLSKVKEKPFRIPSGGKGKLDLAGEEAQNITKELQKIWIKE